VILTDAGGNADAVSRSDKGHGGVLVEKSAEAIAEALIELYNQPEQLAQMATFAKSHALEFYGENVMIDRYSEIFNLVNSDP